MILANINIHIKYLASKITKPENIVALCHINRKSYVILSV